MSSEVWIWWIKQKGEKKKTEGKGPRKKNLKVIHTAEPQRKNLAPACTNTDNCFENVTKSRIFRKKDEGRLISPANKKTWEILKLSSAIEISPKEQDMFHFSVELYARKHKIHQQTKHGYETWRG